jgi:NAD(P)-dependent dehydrogenase (short-subunit alcohol dehydrogenase family)
MGRFSGKSAVVTGAGRGLGRRIALQLVKEGAKVMALGRTAAKLEITAQQAASVAGDGAFATHACDLGVPEQVERAFSEAERAFGKLDILINNAAIYDFFKVAEATPERIRASIDANLYGPLLCIRAAVPLMIKSGGGDIVNVTSEAVRNPYSFLTVYAATKAGLENLSQGLKTELRPDNIRVMALRLGTMADDDREVKMDAQTMQRFMQENTAAMSVGGSQMQYETVAKALADMLCLAADAAFDFVELRPSAPQTPDQYKNDVA